MSSYACVREYGSPRGVSSHGNRSRAGDRLLVVVFVHADEIIDADAQCRAIRLATAVWTSLKSPLSSREIVAGAMPRRPGPIRSD